MLTIAVVLEPCEEGGYSAHVPTIPGCFGEGETVEETLVNIRQAIELHLEAVDDDLIVDENAKVFNLAWDDHAGASFRPPESPASPVTNPVVMASRSERTKGIEVTEDAGEGPASR